MSALALCSIRGRPRMNFFKAIVAAGLVAASTSAMAADVTGPARPFPIRSSRNGRTPTRKARQRHQLPVDRFGRRHQADPGQTVTFGATDAPLKPEQLEKDGLAQWPMMMGAIVPVVNLEGVKAGDMTLDGETLANIYPWQDRQVGRSGDQEAQSEAQAAVRRDHDGASFGRIGHHLQLHRLSVEGQRRLEVEGRRRHRG